MALNKKLLHFKTFANFNSQKLSANEENTSYTIGVDGAVTSGAPVVRYQSICWIRDTKQMWTHGTLYDCNGGDGTSDSPTFLRIGDVDDEAKANFIAVANREKSADYYICASSVQGETNGIVSSLDYAGPYNAPVSVEYTFYGTPVKGSSAGKLWKINTKLTLSDNTITTTYEDVLDAKQDTITDLENIREGAAKGATSVQPDDISEFITVEDVSTVATSGSYEDLTDKPVYITDFDVLSLYNIAHNPDVRLQADKQAIIDALSANKIVLVPYAIDDDGVRGYATLVGYTEDFLYFKVISDIDEIVVETSLNQADIYGQEVTLRQWSDKQDKLISGTNIKTINNENILGSGNITISITESDIATMGFTKNTGTYSKPSAGIPKSDLASAVQTSLGKADTALQSYTEQYKGTITGVSANGTSVATSGVANIPAASTSAYGVTKLSSATNSTSTTLAATASAVKAAYDLANSYKGTVTSVKINGTTKNPSSGVVDLGTVITDISGKQDKLVSGTNIKTINGTSLLGSGDIVISGGGGSSSGSSAYSEVSHGTSDTTFALTPNTFHIWDEVSSLTLTLGTETSGVANEYLFQFTSGSEPTTLSLPDDIKWTGGETPTIEANKIYQVSILKGLGSVLEWDNVKTIKFPITLVIGNNGDNGVLLYNFAYNHCPNKYDTYTFTSAEIIYFNGERLTDITHDADHTMCTYTSSPVGILTLKSDGYVTFIED